ncbi:MAG TPA: vWA domain-containing protein [Patescibacteria group bacterium]|nr:vWA domain-containing protein [Patescibacteria group bacterium]
MPTEIPKTQRVDQWSNGEDEENQGDEKAPKKNRQQELLEEARRQYADFRKQYEKILNAYFGTPDIKFTMNPGGWYIDLENMVVNADPNFFLNQGYSVPEALFASMHEAEHFRDMATNPQAYEYLFARIHAKTDVDPNYPKALQRLYNCLDDVMVNRVVMARWAAGEKAKDRLYPKLFPASDLRYGGEPPQHQPRHRQLMYALLRQAMLPNEPVTVDPEVQEAIDKWQARGGSRLAIDILTSADPRGQARLGPQDRFARIRATLEPVFEEFYRKDLIDRKPPKKESGAGNEFGEDPFANSIPDPIEYDKIPEDIRNIRAAREKKNRDDFKKRHGVDEGDLEAYREDYKKIEKHIEDLSHTFDEVIQRRKSYRRVLKKPVKEGPMLDPRKGATAVAEIRAGNLEPLVMLDFEKREQIRNMPDELEFTCVFDGSGSVSSDAKKLEMQRQLGVLALEAFARFRDRVEKERRRGENIKLSIKSEARIFSSADLEIKHLSDSLTHAERVNVWKNLDHLPGSDNIESLTFAELEKQFNQARCEKLRRGKLKKVIIFFTDGDTNEPIQDHIKRLHRLAGVTEEGGNLVVAGIGFDQAQKTITTYAPNGYYAATFDQVKEIFKQFIAKILHDV